MTTGWLIAARAIHIGSCLLFFGFWAFDRLIAAAVLSKGAPDFANHWRSRLKKFNLALLPLILLSGCGWYALVAMRMSGQSLQFAVLKTVWQQTVFGTVWKFRLGFWFAATALTVPPAFVNQKASVKSALNWGQVLFAGALLGSLAWSGHGLEGPRWHLLADSVHLLVAGFWPTGLLPLLLLLRAGRRSTEPAATASIAVLVRRFSASSLCAVALLAATGVANSWLLVGTWSNLIRSEYGRFLLAKILSFIVAVVIGMINLTRLTPRLGAEAASAERDAAVSRLSANVWWELFLGTAIVVIVAVLGILPPAAR